MHRFFVRPADIGASQLRLSGDEAAHLVRVLRLGRGAQICAFDGGGREYVAVVEQVEADHVCCRILAQAEAASTRPVSISLGQGLPKAEKFEWVIQKATELGVAEIVPLLTERAVPQLTGARVVAKQARWQKIAREACKQCGQTTLPDLWPPTRLEEFFRASRGADLKLMCWEEEKQRRLRTVLQACEQVSAVAVLVGPEGGLTPEEAAQGEACGFIPVGLGTRILRAETAGVVAVALLQHRFGDLG
jgi:16S rRNA (uracil1498-N3)-methyltransferase